ncbi:MAG: hypothetical protein ACOC2Y_01055 [Spirochaetota bacterium]
MKRSSSSTGARIAGVLLLAFFLCSLSLWMLSPRLYRTLRPLDPYVTVVTDLAHDEAERLLVEAGAIEVVTPATTEVLLSRFRFVETVSLASALEALDPLDPRRDPWIVGLSRFFEIDGRNALYVRFDGSLARSERLVKRALGSTSRIAEWSLFRATWALVIFTSVGVAASVAFGRLRARFAPALVPWVPFVLSFGLAATVASAASVLLVAWAAAEFDRVWAAPRRRSGAGLSSLRLRGIVLLVSLPVSAAYLVRLAGWRSVFAFAVAAAGSVAAVLVCILLAQRRYDPDHRPFVPVPILNPARRESSGRAWTRVALLALPFLAIVPPLVDGLVPAGAVSRPVPTAVDRAPLGYGSLRLLRLAHTDRALADRLPDLSDYLAHRAYQEGVVYGREYGFPAPDEELSLTRFREEPDGSYSSFTETVMELDRAWADRALAETPAGIASMLAGLGYATGVVLSPNDAIYSDYSRFLQHLAFVVLVLAPFLLASFPWTRLVWARDSVVELARRRRQVA